MLARPRDHVHNPLPMPLPSSIPHCLYTTPGANANELGDIAVITHRGVIHLFHLSLPNHDLVAHAISRDGLSWQPVQPAIHTGAPGECDDDMIWTMHVVRHPSKPLFRMYYTACSSAENGQVQRVALATSPDLMTWTKHKANPILESRAPHYNEDRGRAGFISFRDPFVFMDKKGLWHMLVTGRRPGGSRFRSGCVAHATSRDGLRWKPAKPLYAPSQFEDLEVPSYLQRGNRHALFFHHFMVGHNLCRVADSLAGPWRPPPRELLLPQWNAVFRFCEWKGRTLLYHWLRSKADWPRRGGAGAWYMALPPPKEVAWDAQGNPSLKTFPGWSRYRRGRPTTLPSKDFKACEGDPKAWRREGGTLRGQSNGQVIAAHRGGFDHFIAEFDLRIESGRAAGLFFRADRALEVANQIRFDVERQTVELHKWEFFDSSFRRYKLVQPTLLQSMAANLSYGNTLRIRLLACAEYIELSLDAVVHLSAATYRAKQGRFAWFVEDGAALFSSLNIQPLGIPPQP